LPRLIFHILVRESFRFPVEDFSCGKQNECLNISHSFAGLALADLSGAGEEALVVGVPAFIAMGQVGQRPDDGAGRTSQPHEVVDAHGYLLRSR